MNSIAGGGSFLSFPALILAGVPSIPANATNSAAMWVGTLGGARAYWGDVQPHKSMLYAMLGISIVGAVLGASLLLLTPPAAFNRLIPWLLLFATALFAASPLADQIARRPPDAPVMAICAQFAVAVYGGYFTAGIGIMMLALLAFSDLPSFNATNGMKNVLAVAINGFSIRTVFDRTDHRLALRNSDGRRGAHRRIRRRASLSPRTRSIWPMVRHRDRHDHDDRLFRSLASATARSITDHTLTNCVEPKLL